MFRKPNPASSTPIHDQIEAQIRHAIEIGALTAGDQLRSIRVLAEELVVNPNTVIRVYRDLEAAGVIEIRHGLGAFVVSSRRTRLKADQVRSAQRIARSAVRQLRGLGMGEDEIRRLVDAELIEQATASRR